MFSGRSIQPEGRGASRCFLSTPRHRVTINVIRTLLRDGVVSYQSPTVTIERFDLWFSPIRPEFPIYLGAIFPKMLELCGEMAQGALLIWSTVQAVPQAVAHITAGARRVDRRPEEIDIAALLPCSVAANRQEAFDALRPVLAFYAGFFPRYHRLLAAQGSPEAAQAIRTAWCQGDQEGAARAVPDALIAAVAVAGTPIECCERIEAYRRAGVTLPIILPVVRNAGPAGKQDVLDALQACAP